jgi:triacylglycerol esterase/lipase EstA (alpha/beta hydrolase family)
VNKNFFIRGALLFAAASFLGLAASAPASAEPHLSVTKHRLSSALHCTGKLSRGRPAPVLLLPGSGSDGSYLFPTGVQIDLSARGVPSCYLNLPAHTTADMQVSAQYVVFAIRKMAQSAGRPIAVFGFSQGGLLARVALTFWPSTRRLVGDVVAASAPQHGSTNLPRANCVKYGCAASNWQRLPTSHLLRVLNKGDETPGPTAWTTLRTLNDTTAVPATGAHPTSALQGASNLVVQEICPGREVSHLGMAFDWAAYTGLVDAITHSGPASASRLRHAHACAKRFVGHLTTSEREQQMNRLNNRIVGNLIAARRLPAEPRVTLRRP